MRALATPALLLLSCGALAGAGCGGGGDDGEPSGASRASLTPEPSPARPIADEVAPFNRANADQDCRAYKPLVFSVVRQLAPETPATATECRGTTGAQADLRRVHFTTSQAYGTAALMEGRPTGRVREYALWVLDGDGRFRYTSLSGRGPREIGTPFTRALEATAVARAFIAAVRRRDCTAMAGLFSVRGRLAATRGGVRGACRTVLAGRILAPAVRASRRTAVRLMGGTRDLAFVGVSTRRTWFTMLLTAQQPAALRVLDVLPSTRVPLPTR